MHKWRASPTWPRLLGTSDDRDRVLVRRSSGAPGDLSPDAASARRRAVSRLPPVPRTGAFLVPGVHHDEPEEHHISEPRINDRIRVAEVRLVGPNGEQVGIVRLEDALRLAQDADLDLVEVAPTARPPVCKIMDFGKFKYEADMKAREARRNQANTILKEIRFRLKIDPHDYGTKKGHVERFLKAGDKVKVMIMFRGREQSRPEMGVRLLQRLAADVAELGFIESMPKQDGRNMIMVLGPTKKKAEQRNEQRRAAAQAEDHADAQPDTAPEPVPWPPVAREPRPEPAAPAEAPASQSAPAPAAVAPRRSGPPAPRSTSTPSRSTTSAPRPASAPRPSSAPRAAAPGARPAPAARPAASSSSPAPSAAPSPAAAATPRPPAPRPTPRPAARPGPPAGGSAKPAPRPGPRATDGEQSG
ncbi:translation initiation factor IF-3 [Cellulomonas flavigena DSM 20109]|uniref:Translation initiation factor IF-3 n=1 Tax=Cellulomonas flavigena (strain ATCC 482 / DSM 20109 / BCRC 11376 / JCM 18109 / NBRC 3775 / NCIMB 8073 / NRS 134) TaxID=446466 RepID=D5UDW4_CELFN|nr:translation initiation factor IF-3 [Cellulomonas flavigena DSM 20109]